VTSFSFYDSYSYSDAATNEYLMTPSDLSGVLVYETAQKVQTISYSSYNTSYTVSSFKALIVDV